MLEKIKTWWVKHTDLLIKMFDITYIACTMLSFIIFIVKFETYNFSDVIMGYILATFLNKLK